jgi:transcriptional regulator with XRE-family HTH domain
MIAAMSTVIESLRQARRKQGLAQSEVARRVGTSQPAVARLESGGVDPRLATVERYAHAVGLRLTTVGAALRPDVPGTARAMASAIGGGAADEALRHAIQLLDDLRGLEPQTVREVLRVEPDPTGSARWDALLGATCEYAAHRAGVLTPGWTAAPSRFLEEMWAPVGDILGFLTAGLACTALAASPPEFYIRGILIDRTALESV